MVCAGSAQPPPFSISSHSSRSRWLSRTLLEPHCGLQTSKSPNLSNLTRPRRLVQIVNYRSDIPRCCTRPFVFDTREHELSIVAHIRRRHISYTTPGDCHRCRPLKQCALIVAPVNLGSLTVSSANVMSSTNVQSCPEEA